jgi:hypothetical protein
LSLLTRPSPAVPAQPVTYLPRLLGLLVVIAALLTACGGDGDNGGGDRDTTPSASGTAAASPGGGSGLPSTGSLLDLDSYRYEIRFQGSGSIVSGLGIPDDISGQGGSGNLDITMKGAWIKPDKAQLEMDLGGFVLRQTVIGNQQWTTLAGQTVGPERAEPGAAEELVLAASFIEEGNIPENLDELDCDNRESVNGVQAIRCDADKEDFERMSGGFNEFLGSEVEDIDDFNMKVWVAEQGGYVVKMDLAMKGTDSGNTDFSLSMALNVTDINSVREIAP